MQEKTKQSKQANQQVDSQKEKKEEHNSYSMK
jgi:hypothetical protein